MSRMECFLVSVYQRSQGFGLLIIGVPPSDKRPFNPFYTHSFNGFNYDLHATDLIVALISAAFQGLKADHMFRAGG